MKTDQLKVGLAQIAPVWFNREATLAKVIKYIEKAASQGIELIAFGEALVPGYPFWIEPTGGARFNAPDQKEIFAEYTNQAVQIEAGHLDEVCAAARDGGIAVYLGIIERAKDRGGHSLYCSMVYINWTGKICSVHRKLQPTYEERLAWSPGDGHGLTVHELGNFTVGGLNCWENWMPLPRAALYGMGEDLHVAIWPGSKRNTHDITPHMAKEGRSFVMSVSALMRPDDIQKSMLHFKEIMEPIKNKEFLADGGSCLCGPDGQWIIEPQVGEEGLYVASINHAKVREERQNFDPAGHYSRPDVTKLIIDRRRQATVETIDE
ncbi:MAG: carbon-nitrogen hydrolase family protein [Emcibacteraceae bacterium]